MANQLIMSETDFATKCVALMKTHWVLSQYGLGWLGELEAQELIGEIEADIDLWVEEAERETSGLFSASSARQQLLGPLLALDLDKLKREGLEQRPQTEREWNQKFSKIDKLGPDEVVDFVLSEVDEDSAQYLRCMCPKGAWSNGACQEYGALTGLVFSYSLKVLVEIPELRGDARKIEEKISSAGP